MAYGKSGNGNSSWKGYSANVQLPATTKCKRCGKSKKAAEVHFSNKQLEVLKDYIGKNPNRFDENVTEAIICKMCTGGPITELQCERCGETKGIEKFTKVQRRNPDEARCMACVEDILNHDPNGGNDSDHLEEFSDGSDDTTSGIGRLSVHDSSIPSTLNSTHGGGVSLSNSSVSSTLAPRHAPHLRQQFVSASTSMASSSCASSDAGSIITSIPTRDNPGVKLNTPGRSSGSSTTPRTASSSKFAKPYNPGPKKLHSSPYRDGNKEVTATSDSDSDDELPVY